MSEIPDNLKYTKEHEWLRLEEDGTVVVGITDYAQESLGDVTFVELPEVGSTFSEGDTFGVVESVKAASDLYMPVSGEVTEINEDLADAPEKVNASPFDEAWMIKVRPDNADDLGQLLDAEAYRKLVV
ncbi:MAG: glycine cleavage system protein GcvH [Opitutales bacterium]|nr:glycine cleavage system protein GcvH [Opitutales bacterium]